MTIPRRRSARVEPRAHSSITRLRPGTCPVVRARSRSQARMSPSGTRLDALDRAAETHANASTEDSDIDEELVEAWRRWSDLTAARPNAQRRSTGDRAGAVNRVCRMLVDAGYFIARGDTDGGTWTARPRFRYTVADLTEDSDLYALVNGLATEATQPGPS